MNLILPIRTILWVVFLVHYSESLKYFSKCNHCLKVYLESCDGTYRQSIGNINLLDGLIEGSENCYPKETIDTLIETTVTTVIEEKPDVTLIEKDPIDGSITKTDITLDSDESVEIDTSVPGNHIEIEDPNTGKVTDIEVIPEENETVVVDTDKETPTITVTHDEDPYPHRESEHVTEVWQGIFEPTEELTQMWEQELEHLTEMWHPMEPERNLIEEKEFEIIPDYGEKVTLVVGENKPDQFIVQKDYSNEHTAPPFYRPHNHQHDYEEYEKEFELIPDVGEKVILDLEAGKSGEDVITVVKDDGYDLAAPPAHRPEYVPTYPHEDEIYEKEFEIIPDVGEKVTLETGGSTVDRITVEKDHSFELHPPPHIPTYPQEHVVEEKEYEITPDVGEKVVLETGSATTPDRITVTQDHTGYNPGRFTKEDYEEMMLQKYKIQQEITQLINKKYHLLDCDTGDIDQDILNSGLLQNHGASSHHSKITITHSPTHQQTITPSSDEFIDVEDAQPVNNHYYNNQHLYGRPTAAKPHSYDDYDVDHGDYGTNGKQYAIAQKYKNHNPNTYHNPLSNSDERYSLYDDYAPTYGRRSEYPPE